MVFAPEDRGAHCDGDAADRRGYRCAAARLDIGMARRLLPLMLGQLPTPNKHPEVVGLLRAWSGEMKRERPEPLIFAAWLRELVRVLCADELGDVFSDYWDYRPRFVEIVLTAETQWCDDIRTTTIEDCPSMLEKALDAALGELSTQLRPEVARWRWGDLHRARFEHPFWQQVPLIGGFASASVEVDGGSDTINRGREQAGRTGPFLRRRTRRQLPRRLRPC